MKVGKMRVRVDWLRLPEHMLSLISEKLFCNIKDYIRFGSVCRSWRSIYIENRYRLPRQLPMLMIPTEPDNWDLDEHTRSFYSLTKKRVLNFQAPVAHNLLCRGSCHGWLVIVDRVTTNVNLFNPFISTNNLIHLPSLTALKLDDINDPEAEYELFGHIYYEFDFYRKFVLSANPASNPNYKVMVIYGGNRKLAFFTPGDDGWTILASSMQLVEDIIYYRDHFYVVQKSGQVFAWDLNRVPSTATKIGPPLEPDFFSRRYLVESSGNLLQVMLGYEKNNKFRVFKLDSIALKWIEMKNLDGHVLFLGDNGSLSLSASDYPECKPNSVYFTDDHYAEQDFEEEFLSVLGRPHDLGIFSLEDRTVEPYYPPEELKLVAPIPIWIEPTL